MKSARPPSAVLAIAKLIRQQPFRAYADQAISSTALDYQTASLTGKETQEGAVARWVTDVEFSQLQRSVSLL